MAWTMRRCAYGLKADYDVERMEYSFGLGVIVYGIEDEEERNAVSDAGPFEVVGRGDFRKVGQLRICDDRRYSRLMVPDEKESLGSGGCLQDGACIREAFPQFLVVAFAIACDQDGMHGCRFPSGRGSLLLGGRDRLVLLMKAFLSSEFSTMTVMSGSGCCARRESGERTIAAVCAEGAGRFLRECRRGSRWWSAAVLATARRCSKGFSSVVPLGFVRRVGRGPC